MNRLFIILLTGLVLSMALGVHGESSGLLLPSEQTVTPEPDTLTGISMIQERPYHPDRLIVRFDSSPVARSDIGISSINADIGATVIEDLSPSGVEGMKLVDPGDLPVAEAIEYYTEQPGVLYAEPDYIYQIMPSDENSKSGAIPDDPGFAQLWGLHNTGSAGVADADIDAPEAWNLETGSQNTIIAVIDTGVDYTHEDLAGNIWINNGEIPGNGIDDDGNGYVDDLHGWDFVNGDSDPADDHSHGTHCAGTIGAVGNNSIGITGVVWKARIMPLKAFNSTGYGSLSAEIAAIGYAHQMGADVISNSWGGTSYSQALREAIEATDAVVVCAAGNSAKNTDTAPQYPASYNSTNIISVASTTSSDTLSSFSNYGLTTVDIGAPGSSVYSTIPGDRYGIKSGTSMATPHVSGVVAMVQGKNPLMTPEEIITQILSAADPVSSLSGKCVTGGRLNAYRAVANDEPDLVPVISGVSPSSGEQNSTIPIVNISGSNLTTGDRVSFYRTGYPVSEYTGTVRGSYLTISSVNLTGVPCGVWNLSVTNASSGTTGHLKSAFTVYTLTPTVVPTTVPTTSPTMIPTRPTVEPTTIPTTPTQAPTTIPTTIPTTPTQAPTTIPTTIPTTPTQAPTTIPTTIPTTPTQAPTTIPTTIPTTPTQAPTTIPTTIPTTPTQAPTPVPASTPALYTITASSDNTGYIIPSGIILIPAGSNQTIHIKSKPGAMIRKYTVDNQTIAVRPGTMEVIHTFTAVSSDHEITAETGVLERVLIASFTQNQTIGPAPLTVQFTDTSFGEPSQWLWKFGDGSTSDEQNPVHTYPVSGSYRVSLATRNQHANGYVSGDELIQVT